MHFQGHAGIRFGSLLYQSIPGRFPVFKRNCVVKYVDSLGIEHAAKVEAESLFEAAVFSLHRLDSSFLDGGGRMGPEKVARQE